MNMLKAGLLGAPIAIALPSTAHAAALVVDVAGSQSFAVFGNAANVVGTFNIGANAREIGVSYDVNITGFDPSYLSEATLAFSGSSTTGGGVFLTPGFQNAAAGTGRFSGSFDLTALDLAFNVGADGVFRLEYFETVDDTSVNPDAIWNSGTVTFTYDAAITPPPPRGTGIRHRGDDAARLRRGRRVDASLSVDRPDQRAVRLNAAARTSAGPSSSKWVGGLLASPGLQVFVIDPARSLDELRRGSGNRSHS